MNIWNKRIDLRRYHIYDDVWAYADFLAVLEELAVSGKLILGGDILTRADDGEIGTSGCSWHYDNDSSKESIMAAKNYLTGISKWAAQEELFIAFVLKNG